MRSFFGTALACLAFLPALTALHVFAALFFPSDPDLGYHLSIGSIVLDEQSFPTIDRFRVASAEPEIAYSWLPDVTLTLANRWAGVLGLRLWVVVSVLILSITVCVLLYQRVNFFAMIVSLLTTSLCFIQLCVPRPRLWSAIFMVLLLLLLRNSANESVSEFRKRVLLIFLLTVFWANSHISVLAAPPIVLAFSFGCSLANFSYANAVKAVILTVTTLLAIVVNPYHFKIYSLAQVFSPAGQETLSSAIIELRGFFEMQAPWPVWVWAGTILLLLWLAHSGISLWQLSRLYFCRKEPARERVAENQLARPDHFLGALLLALIFGWLSYRSSRHFSLFVVAVLFQFSTTRIVSFQINTASKAMGLVVFLFVTAIGFREAVWAEKWYSSSVTKNRYPADELASVKPFLEKQLPTKKRLAILAPQAQGHFINWWLYEHQLSQRAGVVLDGRTDRSGIQRFFQVGAALDGKNWKETFRIYDVDIVIVNEQNKLRIILEQDDSWVALATGKSSVFVRKELTFDIS